MIGKTIDDRFLVVRLLGQGGMGAVFLATQIKLDRPCALKVLLSSSFEIPQAKARFLREARLAARITHPNVVDIIDTGTDSADISYIAMEYIDGESLEKTLERDGPLPWVQARHIILQICCALEAAHARGVIHRDLKPANCMRMTLQSDRDFIKIVDFGIAKALQESEKTKLTQANTPIGTVDYMAYEQACGDDCDHRVDVWAVGVILYELVSGCLPFRGAHSAAPLQRLAAILHREAILLTSRVDPRTIPELLPDVVHKALCKDRTLRYQSVAELRVAIEALPSSVEQSPLVAAPGAHALKEGSGLTELHPSDVVSVSQAQPGGEFDVPRSRREPETVRPALTVTAAATASPDDHAGPPAGGEHARSRQKRVLVALAIALVSIFVIVLATIFPSNNEHAPVLPKTVPGAEPEQTHRAAGGSTGSVPPMEPHGATAEVEVPATGATKGAESTAAATIGVDAPDLPVMEEVKKELGAPPKALPPKALRNADQACETLRRQAKKGISKCIDGRTISFDLNISIDSKGFVTAVSLKNTLLKNDLAFKCLDELFRDERIKLVAPEVKSFACSISEAHNG